MADLKGALEAVLFAGGDPLTEEQLREILQTDLEFLQFKLTLYLVLILFLFQVLSESLSL